MKKILILANSPGGLYRFRKHLIEELLKEENSVYISVPYGEILKPLIERGCIHIDTQVDRRGLNPIKDFKLIGSYYKMINKIKPDLVITYTVKPNIYGSMVSKFKNTTYVVNITGLGTTFQNDGLLKKIIIKMYKFALNKVKIVFFENELNRKIFVDNKIIESKKTVVLNGAGVDLEEFNFHRLPKEDKIRFIYIGRVMKEKGINELFEVASRIRNKFDNIEFDIVGSLEENYESIIKELEKENIINYFGYQSDVKSFIQRSHCCILPSYHEGMSNTLLECASMGRPIITTDIHGCKESINNNKNGYLCKVKNSDDLYNQIVKFINNSYSEKCNMGKESRKHMENKFDKAKVVKDTIRHL